jgi:hypothetical protein
MKLKKSNLKLMIREIVREEVKIALRTELKALSENQIEKLNGTVKLDKSDKTELKPLAKDPVLNKILNETRGGVPQEGGIQAKTSELEEWPSVGGPDKVYDSTSMASLLGYNSVGNPQAGVAQTARDMNMDVNSVPDSVAKAMTRDYSELMKVIDDKKRGAK